MKKTNKNPTSKFFNCCKILCKFFLLLPAAIFLTLASVIVCISGLVVFLPLKVFAVLCARIFRPDLKHTMTYPSSMLGPHYVSNKTKFTECAILILEGPLPLESLLEIFNDRVLNKRRSNGEMVYKELQMYWTCFLGYFFWKSDRNFDLKNHIRDYDYGRSEDEVDMRLPDSEEGFCEEEDLHRVIGHLLSKPWKPKRSPWELLLIRNYRSTSQKEHGEESKTNAKMAAIFRMHHSMGDGYSLSKLMLRDLMHITPNMLGRPPKMSLWERIIFAAIFPLRAPVDFAKTMWASIDRSNPWYPRSKVTREVFLTFSKPISAKLIKRIKNKYGVGYNSVLYTMAAGACTRLMEASGQIVPKSMACFIPYPLPGHPDGLVNHAGMYTFRLKLGITQSAEERLMEVSKQLTPSKFYTLPITQLYVLKIISLFPNVLLKMLNQTFPTAAMTNFPVSISGEPVFAGLGLRLLEVFAAVGPGLGTTGTVVAMVSFNDVQRFSIMIDQKLFPDENIFAKWGDFIKEELKELNVLESENSILLEAWKTSLIYK